MGVSAFLIEIGFNPLRVDSSPLGAEYRSGLAPRFIPLIKLGLFYRLDKSEEVCMLERRLCDVD